MTRSTAKLGVGLLLLLCGCRTDLPEPVPVSLNYPRAGVYEIIDMQYHGHVYMTFRGTLIHAEHCPCLLHPRHMTVTNIAYVTVTNTVWEIPDEVWEKYKRLLK